MRLLVLLTAAAIGVSAFAPADARPRDLEQESAWKGTKEGRILPLPMIESRILPRMRGFEYLGPEFGGGSYRLKFMRDGQIVWIDVDARTGRIIGKSGF